MTPPTPPGDWEVVEEALNYWRTLYDNEPEGHAELALAALARLREREAQRKVLVEDSISALEAAEVRVVELEREQRRWLAWSNGQYPDSSPGDVIAAELDGTITLDDGVTTWNPLRSGEFFDQQAVERQARVARLEEALREIAEWPIEKEEAPYARSMAKELAGIARRVVAREEKT